MKSLAALALALSASDAARVDRTPGEVARFGFPYQSCKASEFEDDQSSSRKLKRGTGGGCAEGSFGNHLGAVLNTSLIGNDAYRPLQFTESSAQTNFAAEFTDGFTLELWVKPQALPQGDTADRVIVSLSSQTTTFTHEEMQTLNCTQDEVSFQLIMKPSGCLVVHTKLISTDDCLASGAYERGRKADISPRQSAFKLPQDGSCATSDYSSDPTNPGLDVKLPATPKLQHVVVSLSAYMGGAPGTGADRGHRDTDQADSKRFAVWVDSVLKTSDEHPNQDGEYSVYGALFNTLVNYGVPCGMKRTDGYRLAADKTKNFVPSAIWGTDHTLRVGFDGTSTNADTSPRFEGEVLLLAMYPRPLTASEVQANFEAKLDNSAPFALDIASVVPEDGGVGGCAQLVPSFASFASDWDTVSNQEYPSLGTAPTQKLTFYVNTTLYNATQRGALYSDETCNTPLASAQKVSVESTSLYFKPAAHEFSSGGPEWGRTYATQAWNPRLADPRQVYYSHV